MQMQMYEIRKIVGCSGGPPGPFQVISHPSGLGFIDDATPPPATSTLEDKPEIDRVTLR
jgi:hypothetical protein